MNIETEMIGQLVRFYCRHDSGSNTIEGVVTGVHPDPDGRHVVAMFSSDGSKPFLYLDQVATFIVFQSPEQSQEVQEESDSESFVDYMSRIDLQGQEDSYYGSSEEE